MLAWMFIGGNRTFACSILEDEKGRPPAIALSSIGSRSCSSSQSSGGEDPLSSTGPKSLSRVIIAAMSGLRSWFWNSRQARLRAGWRLVIQMASAMAIMFAIETRYPGLDGLEMVQADLCRSELLVEIEGIASTAVD